MDKRAITREELLRAALQKKIQQQVQTTRVHERIQPADRSQPLPLSLAQQRLWFLDQLDKAASAAFHMPAALRLLGRLDAAALQATLDRLVTRHEALRTSFVAIDGVPYQQIAPEDCGFALRLVDLSQLPAGEREARVVRLTDEERRAPFDLSRGPLIRGRLLRLADEEHVLLVTMHHIVSDGWSLNILVREVATLYTAFSRGQADPLPPLEIQYADYAQWQRQWLQGEELTRQFDFWKEHLAGAPALLELPTDRPRPAVQSYAGGRIPLIVPAELTARLRAFCQRHDLTPFMVLLSGWGLLLSRLSGQMDVVIGTPVANRQRREVENLIGFFINTLALRLRFDEQPSVEALLARVKETTLAAFAHQELPFEQVVEAVQPQRSLSHSPVAQVVFTWNNLESGGGQSSGSALELPALRLAPVEQTRDTAQVDLQLLLTDAGEVLIGEVFYASDLFDRGTIQRWAGHYLRLLEAMLADASATIDTLPLLSAAEREQQLYAFNATEVAYAEDKLLHELFEQQAAARPDALAVVHENESLTYAELDARANQLAHYLIGLGVQPDDRVAICMERGIDLVVGLLGTLKAGGAYLPLDPAYPVDRLRYMLQDGAPKALLTQSDLEDQLPVDDVPVLRLDVDLPVLARRLPTHNPDARTRGLTSRGLAYVIYTSGSTGWPKGVMVEHGGLTNLANAQSRLFGVDAGSRVLQFASIAFDASVSELAMTLSAGACLCLASRPALLPGEPLQATLRELGITHVTLPAAAVVAFGEAEFPALQSLIVAGDVCPPAVAERWHDKLRFFNAYGPTETTVCASAQQCEAVDEHTVPIGRPIANVRIYILDSRGEPVPVGVEGEIHIGGAGVARGYLNRPELTAERFVGDPFASGRMYKSGDHGRWLPDGTIEYLGRHDFQVKIRGFRIELGEIEAKLSACAGVREAAVIARQDAPGDKRLVAYLVAEEGVTLQAAELRAALSAQLPEYMLPSAFVTLDALPLTANGKLDRKALPAPEASALVTREYEPPQGEIETAVATLWQELLGVPRVGRHDQFFELGGHSLLVVTMVERLRALGWSGEVRAVFASPTLSDYAATLQRDTAAAGTEIPPNLLTPETRVITPDLLPLVTLTQAEIDRIVAAVPGGAGNIQDIYPLLPLQEGMLFHHLLEAEGDTYLVQDLIAFDNKERLDRFLVILQQLVARHDILRTAVSWEALSTPVQVVFRHALLPVETVTLPGEREAVEELRECTGRMRMDLRCAPLLAAYVAEDAPRGEWLLSLLSHHMVCDHETLEMLMADVRALLRDEGHQLAPPLPLRNLVAQTSQVSPAEHEAYFRGQLADIDAPTAPFGMLDVQVKSTDIDTTGKRLDDELSLRLRDCAGKLGVPPSVLFHVAWAQVLARCTGRGDVVFGTVLSGRLQGAAGADRALGMFINTLPLRVSLDSDARQVVKQSYERMVSLLGHEQAPLVLAQRSSGVQPPLPLFTTLMNFRHSKGANAHASAEMEGIRLLTGQEVVNYPLLALVDDLGRGFSLKLQSVRGLDGDRLLRYLLNALNTLVSALESEAPQPLRQLEILPEDERETLLYGFNATRAEYPGDKLVHELFEQQAAARPDAIAVVYEDESLTYAELNARANQLAHYLIGQGVGPDARVAICSERNTDLIVGMLGILKAGGAYVPLDPAYPRERLAWMLEDSAPVALLIQSDVEELLPETELPVLRLDVDVPVLARRLPATNPEPRAHARNLAYVIYTSGSTGTPKGVMVDHRCVTRLVINNPYFEATLDDCFAHCANPAFDAATWEIWGALLNGARLLVVPPAVVMDPARLDATLSAGGVTTLWLTVGLFNQYVDSLPDAFARLRYLLVGGDALDPRTIRQLLQREQRPAHVVNGYGPTETTTFAITHDIVSVADDARSIPLGRPIANTQVYILDGRGEPVPVGVEGEIYIGGDGVARGYLNRPELTAERFLRDPFRAGADARMYKTGDRGRWLPGGTVEFLGRNDFQVKIRGFRIELGEIEARLGQYAGVRDAVVLAREDAPGDKRLVAYLVTEEGLALPVADLREALSRQLPEYMVPSAFVQLDALPLTANGKLDRQALPAPEATARNVREYEAPRGAIEETLAKLWQELLHVERVGRHDNFFELGGHSLLAVQLISHIRATLQVELPLRELFGASSLSVLADAVRAAGASTFGTIEIADRGQPLPLSLAQQRLWFLDQLDKAASAAYHMPVALRLLGRLDVAALQATLDRVVARQEGLRTCFVAVDGVPYQQIAPEDRGFALTLRDLRDLDGESRERAVTQLTAEEVRAPFDLSRGPLIRGQLLTLGDDEHVLLLTQHHIVSDAWSLNILVREVATLYAAFCRGEADPLPPLEIQYADYAQWQRNWLQGEELSRQVDFWKSHLTGAPELLDLPLDRPRPALQSYAGDSVPLVLSPELTARLHALSQRHGVTLFMTLLSAWGLLLSRLSGQTDVVIGTPVANRQRREVENLIGFFVNTLALRLRFDERPSVAALLAQVKETTLAAFAHGELPFEQVVDALQLPRSLSHSPVFQAMLAFNNTSDGEGEGLSLPDLKLAPAKQSMTTAQYELSVHLSDGEAVSGVLVYASDLFDRATAGRWAGYYVRLLEAMAADASAGVEELPLLPEAERRQLLCEFNDTEAAYPSDTLIHELFEQQAAAQPDAPAVVFEGQSLTYSELNARANQLAHELIALGVRPDDRVAICAQRSLEMVVGLLGILKAGGAYVPLDPAYPIDRLQYMLQDAEPKALLTQEALQQALPATGVPTLVLDGDALRMQLPARPASNPDARAHGLTVRNLAYVIYTSGSTGMPKGVLNEHQGVVNRLWWAQSEYRLQADDRVLQKTPFSFDVSVWELFLPLLAGARLVMARPGGHQDPAYLTDVIAREQITTIHFVPSMLPAFLTQADAENCRSLRRLKCSGEALPHGVLEEVAGRLPHVQVHNLYGPTEAAVDVTAWHCRPGQYGQTVPIGRPVANTRMYILDPRGEPVPVGVEGELYIGGVQVARGYLNRPELTAERFVRDPFSDAPDARMYKTGDLGRWLPDGNIEYLGRNDFQVKIRGFRIELGEIEAKLSQCPGVREVVVVAREDVPGDKRLVPYLVADEDVALQASELRAALLAQLPEYMVPSAFVQLDAMPLTANGKLDRQALPAPDSVMVYAHEYAPPEGEIEETLAALWQELLNVPRVGRHDNFFELGGHSLLAVQFIHRLQVQTPYRIVVRDLFQHPSLEALAAHIAAAPAASLQLEDAWR